MKRLVREPLFHFLLLGAALFAVYGFVNRDAKSRPDQVIVSAGQIEHLTTTFSQFHQRPPTAEELKGLIDQYVHEEILSREAVQLGLDRDDTVIRRRLQQKMEFVATDLATFEEPTEQELAEWLAQHPEKFREEPRFTFRHVFLSSDKHRGQLEADAARLLAQLQQSGEQTDSSQLSDSFLLPHEFSGEPQLSVASKFGPEFAAQLAKLKTSEWTGPIRSGFGVHLVLLAARTESHLPALAEVREVVMRDLANERRLEANRKFLAALLTRYEVKIEWPKADAAGGGITMAKKP